MVRGTKILLGKEAEQYSFLCDFFRKFMLGAGYQEIILPNLWEQKTFIDKAGEEVLGQMYTFKDKGNRDICLIPEATAIIQQLYKESWSKSMPKPMRIFYIQRCYRYEKPQTGRYREFTQLGVEILGGDPSATEQEAKDTLKRFLTWCSVEYEFHQSVKRGLSYYLNGNGFEAKVKTLGAQEQIAGGGAYENGVGWAVGLDRLILAINKHNETVNSSETTEEGESN